MEIKNHNRFEKIISKDVNFKYFNSCTLSSEKLSKKLGPAQGWTYAICFTYDEKGTSRNGHKYIKCCVVEGRITNKNKKYYEVDEDLLVKLEIDSTEAYKRIDEESSRDEQHYSTESNSPKFKKLLQEYFSMEEPL